MTPERLQEIKKYHTNPVILELITALEKAWADLKTLKYKAAMNEEIKAQDNCLIRNMQAGHVWTHELSKEYDPAEIIPFDKDFKS